MRPLGKALGNYIEAPVDRLRLHYHAHSAAVGGIIDTVVLIKGIVTYLVAVQLYLTRLARPADNALPQHSLAHIGEKRGNIYSQKIISFQLWVPIRPC